MKSGGNRSRLRFTALFKFPVSTLYSAAKSLSRRTLCPRIKRMACWTCSTGIGSLGLLIRSPRAAVGRRLGLQIETLKAHGRPKSAALRPSRAKRGAARTAPGVLSHNNLSEGLHDFTRSHAGSRATGACQEAPNRGWPECVSSIPRTSCGATPVPSGDQTAVAVGLDRPL